jgi:hypothetical protein
MIAGYWGQSKELNNALYTFARSYAEQNEADFAQFRKAVNGGVLKTASKKMAL